MVYVVYSLIGILSYDFPDDLGRTSDGEVELVKPRISMRRYTLSNSSLVHFEILHNLMC